MNIFLTGGTGFIGSNFVKLALSKSHNLIAIKRSKKSDTKIFLKDKPFWIIKDFSDIEINDFENSEFLFIWQLIVQILHMTHYKIVLILM